MREVHCPHCGARLRLTAEQAHRPAACPVCAGPIAAHAEPEVSDAITANAPPPTAPATGITTPDQVLRHYPRGTARDGDRQTLLARLCDWSGCLTALVLAIAFGLALMCFVLPVCQMVNRSAERTQTMNYMMQVGLACQRFHDVHKTLPTPTMLRKDGKTVDLSWRVSILPFMEQEPLFARFDPSATWDSPANLPLGKPMPVQYENAMRSGVPDIPIPGTYFQYFTGPHTLWPANVPIRLRDIPDGTSDTFLFAEGTPPVPWSKPEDMVIAPDRPLPLPDKREGYSWFVACFADGSVRAIPPDVSEVTIRQLIDPSDGAVVPPF